MDVEAPGRKRRSDAGTVRLSERDMATFEFLAEMKAVYEDDLRVLFGRITGYTPSAEAVRQAIRRWERAGYARAQKLLVKQPRIVWLLPAGAAFVGETTWRETAAVTAMHQAEVARVRLWMEGRTWPPGEVIGWQSERRLRQESAGQKTEHVPDAIVTFSDGTKEKRAAIEVERSAKELPRVRKIVMHLTSTYSLTIYAIPEGRDEREQRQMEAVQRVVRTAYEQVKDANGGKLLPLIVKTYPADISAGETPSER